MELSFDDLRKKEVINTVDGKKMGRVCDIVFCYPENRVLGFVVPGSKAFGFKKEEYFIDLKNIVKIGADVILVNVGLRSPCPPKKGGGQPPADMGRRSFEEYE
ncbi:MAG: YlmC/YmxH family sporulation protein [Clostridia bacterium]|nr:YlmC/YmxH family sporulation protein [Clostridia bacterium]